MRGLDTSANTITFGPTGLCLSEPLDWATTAELEVVPCIQGNPKQNFTFDAAT